MALAESAPPHSAATPPGSCYAPRPSRKATKFLSWPTTVCVRAVLSVVQKNVHTLLRAQKKSDDGRYCEERQGESAGRRSSLGRDSPAAQRHAHAPHYSQHKREEDGRLEVDLEVGVAHVLEVPCSRGKGGGGCSQRTEDGGAVERSAVFQSSARPSPAVSHNSLAPQHRRRTHTRA